MVEKRQNVVVKSISLKNSDNVKSHRGMSADNNTNVLFTNILIKCKPEVMNVEIL